MKKLDYEFNSDSLTNYLLIDHHKKNDDYPSVTEF